MAIVHFSTELTLNPRTPCPNRVPTKLHSTATAALVVASCGALFERGAAAGFEIVAINDLADMASIEYLTRFDSTHGRFPAKCGLRAIVCISMATA